MRKRLYDIREFGAIGDGIHKDTGAIQRTIDVCSENGGGRVVLADGLYLSGGLYLKSGVTLEVCASATLLASGEIADYGTDTHHNRYRNEAELDRCFLYAQDAENIGLCGAGEINGNAECFPNEGSACRPMLLRFLRCRGICLKELRLYNAAAWTTAFLDSRDIRVQGVDIWNEKRCNGDGLDFDGCSHVYVSDCSIKGTDDNLCLQSSGETYPTEDVHIHGCSFSSLCAGVRIGLKSVGRISNVVISGCTMHDVWREGIKIECTEGGEISDIIVSDVAMRNVSRPIWCILNNRFEPDGLGSSLELHKMPEIGVLRNLIFHNFIITDTEEMEKTHYRFRKDVMGSPRFGGIRFDANRGHPIENVILRNFFYTAVGGVKKEEIPEHYPEVADRLLDPEADSSENYYPDWSRTVCMDIRNVKGLAFDDVRLKVLREDGREIYTVENSEIIKEFVTVAK